MTVSYGAASTMADRMLYLLRQLSRLAKNLLLIPAAAEQLDALDDLLRLRASDLNMPDLPGAPAWSWQQRGLKLKGQLTPCTMCCSCRLETIAQKMASCRWSQ